MSVTDTTLKVYHSGGSSNSDPTLDKGGIKSSAEVVDSIVDGVFLSATKDQLGSGLRDHRLHYLVNTHATKTLYNVKAYVFKDTASLDDQLLIGKADEGLDATVDPIANVTDVPPNVEFVQPLDITHAVQFGDIPPTKKYGMWTQREINAGAAEFPNNEGSVIIVWDSDDTSGGNTPPPGPGDEDSGVTSRFVVMADMGCSKNFTASLDRFKKKSIHLFACAGDLAYDDAEECWIALLDKAGIIKITKVAYGNHDVDESDAQPETKNACKNTFGITSDGWYLYTLHNMAWIFMNSEDNPESNPQKDAVKALLKKASENPGIEWIFVVQHRPIYGPDSHHPNEDGVRDALDPVFDQYRVDVDFSGHNHNAWVSKLIKYNSSSHANPTVVASGDNYTYARGAANHGKIYCDVGNGGDDRYGINSVPSFISWSDDGYWGYCMGEISAGGKKLTLTWFKNNDTVMKKVTITHT